MNAVFLSLILEINSQLLCTSLLSHFLSKHNILPLNLKTIADFPASAFPSKYTAAL